MKIRAEILLLMLENSPGWATTAEGFFDFIVITDHLSRVADLDEERAGLPEQSLPHSAKELGTIFLKVVNINLQPYRNFEHVCSSLWPCKDLDRKISEIFDRYEEEENMQCMLEENNIRPDQEGITTDIAIELLSAKLIDQLRPHMEIV